jgi:excisionase family DNA binding protein
MNTDVITLHELAQYLQLMEKTAYRLAADGTLPGFKVGGSWRFMTDIDDWIKGNKSKAPSALAKSHGRLTAKDMRKPRKGRRL